ncbi:MAG: MraY family glycosyltransferase, partial [Patescibacteria group bacterium]
MNATLIIAFFGSFLLSVLVTPLVKKIAIKQDILDRPEKAPDRKIHKKPIPLLGGLAIFIAFNIVLLIIAQNITEGYLLNKHLWGIFFGGLIIMIGGFIDDKYDIKPAYQLIFPILASIVVVASGIGIDYVTNPLGGEFRLDNIKFTLFSIGNLPYQIVILADLFSLLWLMAMMYTTKILDGVDGLVTGLTTIGAFIIFFLSMTKDVYQPETAALALILAGACLGFFLFNFNPAKIFLGEGGSLYCGFMLGVLSIISGGKIATALLIMGIPMIDVVWTIIRRLFFEKKSFTQADRKHLHHRLLDIGLSPKKTLLLFLG